MIVQNDVDDAILLHTHMDVLTEEFPWTSVDILQHLSDHFPEDYRKLVLEEIGAEQFHHALETAAKIIHADTVAFKRVFPPPGDVYTALRLCPVDSVRVLMIGQDPYIQKGQAHGLAFSVLNGSPPPSLKGILERVQDNTGAVSEKAMQGDLSDWAKQGVLLLNTVLTVREKASNTHANGNGWEIITKAILQGLSKHREKLVIMLWGRPAQCLKRDIDFSNHKVLEASHPSPLGRHAKAPVPFSTMKHFAECNAFFSEAPIQF